MPVVVYLVGEAVVEVEAEAVVVEIVVPFVPCRGGVVLALDDNLPFRCGDDGGGRDGDDVVHDVHHDEDLLVFSTGLREVSTTSSNGPLKSMVWNDEDEDKMPMDLLLIYYSLSLLVVGLSPYRSR